jgi:hypothetical protein
MTLASSSSPPLFFMILKISFDETNNPTPKVQSLFPFWFAF